MHRFLKVAPMLLLGAVVIGCNNDGKEGANGTNATSSSDSAMPDCQVVLKVPGMS